MPAWAVPGSGTEQERRVARGPHDLTYAADEAPDQLWELSTEDNQKMTIHYRSPVDPLKGP